MRAGNTAEILSRASRPRGIALVFALILLVVITLLGLAAIRGTTVLQKLSANFYDRQLAFESAEAGLEAAAQNLSAAVTGSTVRNCGNGGVSCQANPFNDSSLPSGDIQTVGTVSASLFPAAPNLNGTPQYVIENMGSWVDPTSSTGYNQTANSFQYGAQGANQTVIYYRITARSGDPSKVGDRAVVTLQAMYKN